MDGRDDKRGIRLPADVHRGLLAGLSEGERRLAVEAHEEEKEGKPYRETYPRIGDPWRRLPYGVRSVQAVPKARLEDCLNCANKQVSVGLLRAMGVRGVGSLRKQQVVDRVVAEMDRLPAALESMLTSCCASDLAAFMRLLDRPGAAFRFTEEDGVAESDLAPFEPLIWVFACDRAYHALIPREVAEAARKIDVEKIERARARVWQVPAAVNALRELYGVAPVSEVAACCNELFGFEPELREVLDALDGRPREYRMWGCYTISYDCWPDDRPSPEGFVVHGQISDARADELAERRASLQGIIASCAERAPWTADGSEVLDYDTCRRAERRARDSYINRLIAKRAHGLRRRPLSPEMGEGGLLGWMYSLPEAVALRDWLDEHVPDGQDDFEYADNALGSLIRMRHGFPEGRQLLRAAEEKRLFDHTFDKRELVELLANLEDALPSWALNGWSPREMRKRMEDEADAAPEREGEPEAA